MGAETVWYTTHSGTQRLINWICAFFSLPFHWVCLLLSQLCFSAWLACVTQPSYQACQTSNWQNALWTVRAATSWLASYSSSHVQFVSLHQSGSFFTTITWTENTSLSLALTSLYLLPLPVLVVCSSLLFFYFCGIVHVRACLLPSGSPSIHMPPACTAMPLSHILRALASLPWKSTSLLWHTHLKETKSWKSDFWAHSNRANCRLDSLYYLARGVIICKVIFPRIQCNGDLRSQVSLLFSCVLPWTAFVVFVYFFVSLLFPLSSLQTKIAANPGIGHYSSICLCKLSCISVHPSAYWDQSRFEPLCYFDELFLNSDPIRGAV